MLIPFREIIGGIVGVILLALLALLVGCSATEEQVATARRMCATACEGPGLVDAEVTYLCSIYGSDVRLDARPLCSCRDGSLRIVR